MEHESQESSLSIDIRKNLACMRKLGNGLTCVFLPEADALAVTEENRKSTTTVIRGEELFML